MGAVAVTGFGDFDPLDAVDADDHLIDWELVARFRAEGAVLAGIRDAVERRAALENWARRWHDSTGQY